MPSLTLAQADAMISAALAAARAAAHAAMAVVVLDEAICIAGVEAVGLSIR
jgi:uncharacterized protein GlcG (DUF336 family)